MKSSTAENNSRRLLIVGAGRLSQHIQHYFGNILGHDLTVWPYRDLSENFPSEIPEPFDAVFLLCRDQDIEKAFELLKERVRSKRWLHASGTSIAKGVESWHPLASFSTEIFPDDVYARIPFVVSLGAPDPRELFAGFENSVHRLRDQDRALYHALCVLSGNVSALLWNHAQSRAHRDLGLPFDAFHAFAETCLLNFRKLGAMGQSGPLTRGDHLTIQKNLEALGGDAFGRVLQAALNAVTKNNSEKRVEALL